MSVPWSRILSDTKLVLPINTDANQAKTAWVTIDASLHRLLDMTARVTPVRLG